MFILIETGGEWEDAYKRNLYVSSSKELLQKRKTKLEEQAQRVIECKNLLRDFKMQYGKDHPYPNPPNYLPIPRWKSGLPESQITDKMRKERADLEQRNAEIRENFYQTQVKPWQSSSHKDEEDFIASLNLDEELIPKLDTWGIRHPSFSIQEIEELKEYE